MEKNDLIIHYWQLPEDIFISLKNDFHEKFCDILKEKTNYNFKNCFYIILKCPKWHAQRLFTKQIRFTIKELEALRKYSELSEQDIEKEIESIGTHEDGTIVKNPKFPFQIKDLVYIASHLMFDGSYRDKKGCYFYAYEDTLVDYHKMRLSAFGEVSNSFMVGEWHLQFSYFLGYIVSKILDLSTFNSTECFLSEKFKTLLREDKTLVDEIVKALIIDEGSIDDKIKIELSNERLVYDLFEVISKYYHLNPIVSRTRDISFKGNDKWRYTSTVWKLNFSASSFKDLLFSLFPLPINYKQENLEFLCKLQMKNGNQRKIGETKKLIIFSLLENSKTIEELAKELLVKQTTIRAHLKGHPTFKDYLIGLGIVGKVGEKLLRRGGYAKSDIFGIISLDKAKEFLSK